MKLEKRIGAFSELGSILRNTLAGVQTPFTDRLTKLIETQHLVNPWFTPGNVSMALREIARVLNTENLTKWTDAYPILKRDHKPLKVAVIMPGNIPLAGFHDFLSVLISGNHVLAKPSTKDPYLIRCIANIISDIDPEFNSTIEFADGIISGFDTVIATGSDNTSRYFEHYFGKCPNIIRKNRNSIAIIDGTESAAELEALGTDVFSYFGLGCRSVSKLYVPEGYDFSKLIISWKRFGDMLNHNKYANNYDFHKAVFMVNGERFTDTGFLLIKEDQGLASPVAVLYFEYYRNPDQVSSITGKLTEKIQCIAGKNHTPFGMSQSPELWDYADGTDTLEFLLKKKFAGIL